MSSAKWSGIEQWKYGLTARWYVSAKYGYATDEGGWGLYNPSTNVDGWGGKKRPFNGLDLALGQSLGVIVVDSGYYSYTLLALNRTFVGDGLVVIYEGPAISASIYNITGVSTGIVNMSTTGTFRVVESFLYYSNLRVQSSLSEIRNSVITNCTFLRHSTWAPFRSQNSIYISCSGNGSIINSGVPSLSNIFIGCSSLNLELLATKAVTYICDYSIVIGNIQGNSMEYWRDQGQYFRKSFSEVDLFGNASGSGATVTQLNMIFNNFYYPYIDDWQYLDLSLRPDVDHRVRYGGLNGHFIGALPVGYHFDIPTLWNTYRDAVNTTNVELNMMDRLIRTNPAIPGVYTSTTITLPNAIDETDVAMFFKNNVYDSNGVAVQRLDYSVDPAKDNTLEQRTVYSYRMKTSPDDVTPLTDWKEYELDRAPTVDASGNSNINDLFDSATETKQKIKQFIIEITLRSE